MKYSFDKELVRFYLWVGIIYFLLWVFHNLSAYPGYFFQVAVNNFWRTLYVVVVNYIFLEHTVPFVLRKRKYLVYNVVIGAVMLFVFLMFWSFGLKGWRNLGILTGLYTDLARYSTWQEATEAQMAFSMGSVFFFGILRHIYNYVKLKQAAQQLRIQKQQAELNYLKSQTNPHFLFNTLNNIYSLARDKNDQAPESILRLSKILRYMLYEAGGAFVAIEQELKIISDYIELEKLRYDDSLLVNFHHNVEDMKQAVPPLLLMPLVENAFKHGVSETRGRPFIDIHLSVNKRQLEFIVRNSSENTPGATRENIGLANLRRQLELLYRESALSVQQEPSVFVARLQINLASHV